MTRIVATLEVLVVVLATIACAAASVESPSPSSGGATPAAPASPTPAASLATLPAGSGATLTPSVPAEARPAVEAAKQDLANRRSVAIDQISVATLTSVTWPSTALGCPQPGLMYAQIVTPGYKIVLQVGGQTYEYHSDRGKRVVYCPNPP